MTKNLITKTRNSHRATFINIAPQDSWWEEMTKFFDVPRSRVWIMVRRMNHSTHHRGQLIVYLRLLEQRVTSVYGPTADTDGKVIYRFE